MHPPGAAGWGGEGAVVGAGSRLHPALLPLPRSHPAPSPRALGTATQPRVPSVAPCVALPPHSLTALAAVEIFPFVIGGQAKGNNDTTNWCEGHCLSVGLPLPFVSNTVPYLVVLLRFNTFRWDLITTASWSIGQNETIWCDTAFAVCFHCLRGYDNCLCRVFSLPSWLRQLLFPCVSTAFVARHWLCLVFPLPSWLRQLPLPCVFLLPSWLDTGFALCFHCHRG